MNLEVWHPWSNVHFIQTLHYSNHNALASRDSTNTLISFDSCTPPPRRLYPALCLCELGFFGDPHKRFLKSEGPDCHCATHRLQPTDTVWDRNTPPLRSFTDVDASQAFNRSTALHRLNSMPQKENGGNTLFLIYVLLLHKEPNYFLLNKMRCKMLN